MQTILVCDDDKEIVDAIDIYLTGEGFRILKAYDGYDALKILETEHADLMIIDVMMPGLDGIRTTLKVRETSSIPIIILSAKSEDTDKILGLNIGADDYITKPFDVEILRSKLNNLVKRREQLKQFFTKSLAGTSAPDTDESDSAIPSNPFMDLVVKNIEMHLDDSTFEAKVLADSLNMSLPTLYRKIKQFSDCSILELTRTIRLKKAAELIQTQQYSVQEVAEMVGFNDTATFRKRFTEQYGTTPSQYGQP